MNTNWIYLPVQYLKNSFKKIDDRTIEFKIKNMEGSARVNISPSIYLDGNDISAGSTVSTKEGEFEAVKKNMDLDILLGESIVMRSVLEKPLNPGSHKIKVIIGVNFPLWTTFELEFKVKA